MYKNFFLFFVFLFWFFNISNADYWTWSITWEVIKNFSWTLNISDTYNLEFLTPYQTWIISTWSLDAEILNEISNNLKFQNDLLIYIFWFLIMFFSFLLSFKIYNYFSKSYFFNKINIWKK